MHPTHDVLPFVYVHVPPPLPPVVSSPLHRLYPDAVVYVRSDTVWHVMRGGDGTDGDRMTRADGTMWDM